MNITQSLYYIHKFRNCKTSDLHRIMLNLSSKIELMKREKYAVINMLLTFSACYSWKNIKILYKSNKLKISTPTWHNKFELPDEFYSV